MSNSYSWAVNKLKLEQSIQALNSKKKLDPKFEFGEDEVKEEYKKRAGLLREKTVANETENSDTVDASESEAPRRRRRSE